MGKSSTDTSRHPLFERPIVIVLVYFTVSAIWILLSDNVVYLMIEDESLRNQMSMVKGIAFILITSLLLYYLVKKGFDSLRRSQASLRQSETRIRAMIERAPYGIIESDENGYIIRANLKANEILGTSPVELIGSNLKDFMVLTTDVVPDLSTTPVIHDGIARFSRKNGKSIWVQRVSSPISDEIDSEKYVLEMIQDVTGQKESTTQLAEELEALYGVSRKIIGSDLATDSLESICGVTVDRLQASSATVYVLDLSGNMVKIAEKGTPPYSDLETVIDRSIPNTRTLVRGGGTWAVVSLNEDGTTIGAMVFGYSDPEFFTRTEWDRSSRSPTYAFYPSRRSG